MRFQTLAAAPSDRHGGFAMPDSAAFPIIFFLLSYFVFGSIVLYALAKAWEKALSGHPGSSRPTAFRREENASRN
jgi:hypothetical protein